MAIIKMSVCKDPYDTNAPYETLFEPFEQGRRSSVELQIVPWENYKQEMLSIALHNQKHNMDLAQVGAPVISDLISMNAIRPFSPRELDLFGGISAFAPVAWNKMGKTDEIYSIPSILDGRALIYWRDMFEDAGVDEKTAFVSFDHLEQSLTCLQEKGLKTPWAFGITNKLYAFQTACIWMWGLGGEISKNNEILLDRPEAVDAILRYFDMRRFMPAHHPNLSPQASWQLFLQRKVAAVISNQPAVLALQEEKPDFLSKIGVVLVPGPTYVGGSSLIIWRDSRNIDESIQLVRHLTSHETQLSFPREIGFMPARSSALNDSYFSENPMMSVFSESIFSGRTYVDLQLGGLIEDLLSSVIGNVWIKLIEDPQTDPKAVLLAGLAPAIRRISLLWDK